MNRSDAVGAVSVYDRTLEFCVEVWFWYCISWWLRPIGLAFAPRREQHRQQYRWSQCCCIQSAGESILSSPCDLVP